MFERFTEKAIKAIMLAQEEGRRLGHNFVGTEQILLGLIGEGTGVAAKVLKSMGVKLKDARLEVEKIIGRGSGDVGAEMPFTDKAKRVLKLSLEEARQLEHNYIGTEHLLLGLIREGEGVAVRVLENLGVDLSKVPTLINEMLLETVEVEVDISQKSEKIFERFAEKAIKAILLAQEEARRLGHNFVGTEQILLGLIGEGTGVAAKVLKSMGVKLKDARLEVEKIIGRGSGDVGAEIPFTDKAKRVLKLSLEEARQLEHNYIGTEHLLLGLIREGEGVAARVLENLGVDISKVRTQVIQMLGEIAEVEEDISQDDSNTPQDNNTKQESAISENIIDENQWANTQNNLDAARDKISQRSNFLPNIKRVYLFVRIIILLIVQIVQMILSISIFIVVFIFGLLKNLLCLGLTLITHKKFKGEKLKETVRKKYSDQIRIIGKWTGYKMGFGTGFIIKVIKSLLFNSESFSVLIGLSETQPASYFLICGDIYYEGGKFVKALKYYKKALTIFRKIRNIDIASDEGKCLIKIGRTFHSLAQYEEAIASYYKALEVSLPSSSLIEATVRYRMEQNPQEILDDWEIKVLNDWAEIQFNLGRAYTERIKGNKAENIEAAIAAYAQALLVCTQTEFPIPWATTQNNLGIAYSDRIRGNKAQNMEAAIAAYEQALLVLTQTDFPMEWAATQNNLGSAYSNRIRGNKAQNMEAAIAAYKQALLVRTQTDFPTDWARTQDNLGVAYCKRIRGEKAENIEMAIAAYEKALLVRTQTDFPMDWARTQYNLGIAYSDRIRGNKAQNMEAAIAAYEQALLVRTQTDFPMDWARTQYNLGSAYGHRIRGDKAQNMEAAIAAYQQALLVYTQTDFPMDWANTQNNLGLVYSNRIRGNKAQNIEAAIAACQQALLVYTQTDFPMDWAATQNNLGIAYSDRIRGDKAQNIEAAIAAFQQALLVRSQTDFPMDWAQTQTGLGVTYSNRIRGDKAQNIETAIAAYQQALLVYTQTDFPMEWATTQTGLGTAYSDRIRGDKAQNIETAIAAYQQALLVQTQTDFPMDWAMTQNNLGIAYSYRIGGDKAQNIEAAITAYQQALLVYTQTDFPMEWATTQNNLGIAYLDRIRGNKAQNMEAAIAACQQALLVRTQTDFPMDWAATQNNLGIAYSDRIRGDKAENIEATIAAFQQALLVRTQTDFPIQWATTQHNLGLAYINRIRGDKAENIEAAISCYDAALRVRKPKTLPADCLRTARSLANLAAKQQNYQLAIKNYELAIAAIEQSRDWTPDEMARQEILRNNIYVYQNMVQACVNTQQYDKALETVERFRCRRLLDLILTKDFYKDREVPEDIRNLEAQMEDKQREIDYLRQQLKTPKNNQEKTGASRHISRDEWDDITEEIENLMTKKQEIWQQLRELDPVLSEGIQAPTVSVEKMKELLEIPQQPGEPFHVTASNSPSPQQNGEKQTKDVALLSFYTTDHETYIFILTQTGVKLHRCQEQGYKNFQLWLRDNWLKPYSERNYLAAKHAAANLAKCDIDAIESIHSKASKVLVQLTDGTTTEIDPAQFETTRKQQKHKLYKQWQNQMEETLKELADRLQINQLIEKLTDIKEIILVPFMYLHQIPLPILPLDNGQYLGEKFRVRIAPSTQVLTFCQKQPPNREKNLPPYGIVENTKDDLPYTPTECQLVAQIYGVAPQHHLKGSKEATKAKYKKLLTREKVLGLLSSHHATSNLTQPLESKLLLGDTDLTLGELLNATIRFPQVGDLFLSCCETALGNSELTDDIFTLSAAFLSAGASNVISSLWAVNDLATTILSYFFHRNRAAGIPSVDALCQGQMELKELTLAKAEESLDNAEAVLEEVVEGSVEYEEKEKIVDNCQEIYDLVGQAQEAIGGEKPFDHPYYWAGFVCQG